jgi:carboxyl-terminal processing protease
MPNQKRSMAEPTAQQRSVSKSTVYIIVALVAVVSYVAGTRHEEIVSAVGPALGIRVASGTLDLSSTQRAYGQLKANYDGKLDEQSLIDGATRGMVAAAGDKYTVFMDAKEAKEFNDDLTGTIGGGIGAEIATRNDQPTIVRILEGNPAQKAGLLAGDVIVSVNDQSASGWASDKAARAIRGEAGTTVKLEVLRNKESKTFTVTRAIVNNPSVTHTVTDGIGTIKLSRFDDQTATLARQAAQDLKRQNVRGVVLDLRSNGGGYLTAAQDVAGLWLDKKTVVTERTFGKVVETITSGGNPLLAGVPTVVLIDSGTASASEIVAGALQDYGAATLVGEKSFGKGTVQKVVDLSGGAILKVTTARWYTPKGKNITSEGIAPNKEVPLSAGDVNAGRDPQMDAAKAQLAQ